MDYVDMSYLELKQECAARKIGGGGKRPELVAKLLVDDAGPQTEPDAERKEPSYSNWDENGNWVRRPKGFVSWAEEKRKAEETEAA